MWKLEIPPPKTYDGRNSHLYKSPLWKIIATITTQPQNPTHAPFSFPFSLASTSLPFFNNLLVSSLFISTSPGNSPLQSSLPPKCLNTTLESKSLHFGSALASS
jgi:hypothetical protein